MSVLAVILVLVGALNFAGFFAASMMIGGTADPYASQDGRCFVSQHGKLNEVSEEACHLSRIHSRSVLITRPLALLGMVLLIAQGMNKQRAVDSWS